MTNEERDQVLRRVAAALTRVVHPVTGDDVVSSGRVRDLDVLEDGTVRFRFALQADDPGNLVRQSRVAAEQVDGVRKVKIDIALPATGHPQTKAKSPLRAGSVPAPAAGVGVGDRAGEHLADRIAGGLRGELQDGLRLVGGQPADQVHHAAGLPWRDAYVPRPCPGFHWCFPLLRLIAGCAGRP